MKKTNKISKWTKRPHKPKMQSDTRRDFIKSSALSIGALLGSSIIEATDAAT